jgi:hypothetical protein
MNYKWIRKVPLLTLALLICLIAPAMAQNSITRTGVDQDASGVIVGDGNNQDVLNLNGGTINVDPTSYSSTYTSYTTIDTAPEFYNLNTADVSYTRLVYPNEVIAFKALVNTTYKIISGTPIAVFTVDNEGKEALDGSESKLIYDKVYHRFETGIVLPIDKVPYLTTKCMITPSEEATYVVIDNRYFPSMMMVEVIPIPFE